MSARCRLGRSRRRHRRGGDALSRRAVGADPLARAWRACRRRVGRLRSTAAAHAECRPDGGRLAGRDRGVADDALRYNRTSPAALAPSRGALIGPPPNVAGSFRPTANSSEVGVIRLLPYGPRPEAARPPVPGDRWRRRLPDHLDDGASIVRPTMHPSLTKQTGRKISLDPDWRQR